MDPFKFSARVYNDEQNPCIDIPREVSGKWGKRGFIPVKAVINSVPYEETLVPKGRDAYRLFLNGEVRKKAKVEVGDFVSVELVLDDEPRRVVMVPQLIKALKENKKAKVAFDNLSAEKQTEMLRYLNFLRSSESRERNVKEIIAFLMRNERLIRKGKKREFG